MNPASSLRQARPRGRPPRVVAGQGTREALLRAGVALLSERGFAGTGLEQLLRQVGVPKGSFYHFFASKEDFGLATVDAYAAYFAGRLDRSFGRRDLTPLGRLVHFMDEARAGMARFAYRRGCVVGNLGQEVGILPEPLRRRLHAVLLDWQRLTTAVFAEARRTGEFGATVDADRLAAFFWIGWEGVVLRARLERGPAPIDTFERTFMQLLAPPGGPSGEDSCSTPW